MRGVSVAKVLVLASVILFVLAAVGVAPTGVDLVALGLACWASSLLVP